jgi:hypothetical protein
MTVEYRIPPAPPLNAFLSAAGIKIPEFMAGKKVALVITPARKKANVRLKIKRLN